MVKYRGVLLKSIHKVSLVPTVMGSGISTASRKSWVLSFFPRMQCPLRSTLVLKLPLSTTLDTMCGIIKSGTRYGTPMTIVRCFQEAHGAGCMSFLVWSPDTLQEGTSWFWTAKAGQDISGIVISGRGFAFQGRRASLYRRRKPTERLLYSTFLNVSPPIVRISVP